MNSKIEIKKIVISEKNSIYVQIYVVEPKIETFWLKSNKKTKPKKNWISKIKIDGFKGVKLERKARPRISEEEEKGVKGNWRWIREEGFECWDVKFLRRRVLRLGAFSRYEGVMGWVKHGWSQPLDYIDIVLENALPFIAGMIVTVRLEHAWRGMGTREVDKCSIKIRKMLTIALRALFKHLIITTFALKMVRY